MKTALITGASGDIGLALVQKFIENGFFTVCQYNSNVKPLMDLKERLKKDNLSDFLFTFKADFNKSEEVNALFDYVENNFSHVDVLINNAGVDLYKSADETSEEEWDRVFNVNTKAPFILTKRSLKEMIKRKSGKIVFISSVWGEVGGSMETAYSASKSAISGYVKALAKELGDSGINVNAVAPGVIDTKMNDIFTDEEKEELILRTPLKKMGSPKDVAELVYFLSGEKANFITGQIITVDGGFTL